MNLYQCDYYNEMRRYVVAGSWAEAVALSEKAVSGETLLSIKWINFGFNVITKEKSP